MVSTIAGSKTGETIVDSGAQSMANVPIATQAVMATLEGVSQPTEHVRAQKAAYDKAALADEIGACADSQDPATGAAGPADLLGRQWFVLPALLADTVL